MSDKRTIIWRLDVCTDNYRRDSCSINVGDHTRNVKYWEEYRSIGELIKSQDEDACFEIMEAYHYKLRSWDFHYLNEKMSMFGSILRFMENQNEALCLKAVKQNGLALRFVKDQTEEICWEAIRQNAEALEYVKNQTREICLEAIKKYAGALDLVRDQSEELHLEAVGINGGSLGYIDDQTEEMGLIAVRQDGFSLVCVHNKTLDICLEAIKENPKAIRFVTNREMKKICQKFLEGTRFLTTKSARK